MAEDAVCGDQWLVFGYAITDPDSVLAVDAAAMYRCKPLGSSCSDSLQVGARTTVNEVLATVR